MNSRQVWTVAGTVVLGVGAAVIGTGWLLATHVLPGPWHARHTAQSAADRVAPGLVEVTSASWSFDRGGFTVHARLRDDPDADVVWRMTSSSGCGSDPSCDATIRSAVGSARYTAEETRTLVGAFAAGGCPVAALYDLSRRGDTLEATIYVAVPRAEVPIAAPRLDACVRAWARARNYRDGAPSVGADLRLVEPGTTRPGDADQPLVARLASITGGSVRSSALSTSDAAGVTRGSSAASLRPSRGLDGGIDAARAVDGPVAQWLATQGDPGTAPRVNDAYTRYLPGRTDRVRMYAPWAYTSTPAGVPRSDRAVACTVDVDGGHPSVFSIVPMVDGSPADPLAL